MKNPTKIDGQRVWEWHATHGVPVEFTIPELAKRGYIPTWYKLLIAAMYDGVNIPRLIRWL